MKITGKTPADDNTRRVKIAVPLKYLGTIFGELFKRVVNKIFNKRYETLCYFFCKKESKIFNKRYETLCYFFCKKESKICNKKYETLCSSRHFINLR